MSKKRLWNLSVIMMIATLSIGFISCGSDDDEDEFSLVGKTYAAFAYHSSAMDVAGLHFDGYDAYWVYRFTSTTECERQSRKGSPTGGIIGDIDKCTYTLNYPTITIVNGTSTITGTFIDQNTFRTGSGSNVLEYIKQ